MTMVSRNMTKDFHQIFYPQVDYGGSKSQIIGMEFPLLNVCIAIANRCFGYAHWYGRLINLIFSSIGMYFFYLLVSKLTNEKHAFYATFILISTLWFAYSRKIMPDTFSASFIIAGIYFSVLALEKKTFGTLNCILACIFITIGGLSKISTCILLVFIVPFLLKKEIGLKVKAQFLIALSISGAIILIWYIVWVPYLNTLSEVRFFMGISFAIALHEIIQRLGDICLRFYETAIGISGFVLFVVGLYLLVKQKQKSLLTIFLLGTLLEILFLCKTGAHFAIHTYYIIPYVPIMTLIAGYVLSVIPKRYATILCFILFIENGARLYGEFIIKPKYQPVEHIDRILDSLKISRNTLIATNGNASPTVLYFSQHIGWTPSNEQLQNTDYIHSLMLKSCEYIIIDKQAFSTDIVLLGKNEIFNNNSFRIYKLTK
jgi:4-amino-4-deoxy-L-arabinose transferase-like glycosyltransferase